MPIPLLARKLPFPPFRAHLAARPRLAVSLRRGLQSALMLVSAPAGDGKKTLVSAWLSLDSGENGPGRFLFYLALALGTLSPGRKAAQFLDHHGFQPASSDIRSLVEAEL